jgi:hypothetical protein
MTDAELEGIARQALNVVQTEIRNKRQFNFYFGAYFEGEGLRRMSKIEAELIERLGEDWLNSGVKKDYGFAVLRLATAVLLPHAAVLVTAMNMFKSNKAFDSLSPERQKYYTKGHDRNHEGVKAGYFDLKDALAAIAQTPERICMAVQILGEERIESRISDLSEYDGRTKLYVSTEEALRMLAELEREN